jgi:hypothetical protein
VRAPSLSESGGDLRAALILAVVAAVVVMFDLFTSGIRYACLGVIVAVGALTATERRRAGSGWWDIFAIGAGISILGALLSGAAEVVGGILALIGGALIIAAAAIGFPPGD